MNGARGGPVVVLSPHLDDAVLSAWSVIDQAHEVVVLNLFAGVPEVGVAPLWDRLAGATDSRAHVLHRLVEDREALALAGRTPISLPFLDHQYRGCAPDPEVIAEAVTEHVPAASTLYAPAAIGAHPDHVIARDLALDLGRGAGPAVALYADLPYAAERGWPAWVSGAAPEPHLRPEVEWEIALAGAPLPREALEPRVRRLGGEQRAAKLRALRRYRTQFPLLNRGSIGLLEHPLVLGFETHWTVDPAALA